jgi:hypothetical protein
MFSNWTGPLVIGQPMWPTKQGYDYLSVLNGSLDALIDQAGAQLAGHPNWIVRLGWECDGDWFEWGAKKTGKNFTVANHDNAWQRITNRMIAAGFTGAFEFNACTYQGVDPSTLIPSANVDYVGSDIYATSTTYANSTNPTTTWNTVGGPSFDMLGKMIDVASKRFGTRIRGAVSEWGPMIRYDDGTGLVDNALWPENARQKFMQYDIAYSIMFNKDDTWDVAGNNYSAYTPVAHSVGQVKHQIHLAEPTGGNAQYAPTGYVDWTPSASTAAPYQAGYPWTNWLASWKDNTKWSEAVFDKVPPTTVVAPTYLGRRVPQVALYYG